MQSNASTMVKTYFWGYPRDLGSPSATRLPFVSTTSRASQTQPTPARIAFSITHRGGSGTESDPRWGWLDLACGLIMDKLHVVVMHRNNQTRYTACSVAAVFTRQWLPLSETQGVTRQGLQYNHRQFHRHCACS